MTARHMPAEDAPHARTWMCWPTERAIYGETAYHEAVQETVGRLAAAIAEHEPVSMLAGAALHPLARRLCGPKVALVDIPTDDMWARDSGPVFVRHGAGLAATGLNFNGWGAKKPHATDARVAERLAAHLGVPFLETRLCGEGGGIEFDGEGTALLTDSCWVNDNRNPGLTRAQIEAELRRLFGLERVIWLPGVAGQDDTDGHIDGVIRVIRPGLVLMSGYPGDRSDWGRAYAEARTILERSRDARGRGFEIVELPFATRHRSRHPEFFSGYANYYVGNGAVWSPEFGDRAADERARETLARLYPGRRVVMLDVDRIYENGGGIHCVTQQQPA